MLPLMIATIDDDADRAFMTRIYYRYRRYMYKTIGTFVSDPWDADDVFQTTLPNLIDHLDTLKSLPKNMQKHSHQFSPKKRPHERDLL